MGFIQTNAGMDQLGFVRGPAMIYAAPITTAPPAKISDVIKTDTVGQVSEVQTLSITGTPTGGSFKLAFRGPFTGSIAWNATAAVIQTALDALSTIGTANTLVSGGPLPATPVVITFQGSLAQQQVPAISPVSVALTGGTTPAITVVETTPGLGQYDPIGTWFALGGTKNGVVPTFNDAEEAFNIDQYTAAIGALPTDAEWSLQTSLVELTIENLAFIWDMGPVTVNTTVTPNEKRVGMGTPSGFTQRRIAVIYRRTIGTMSGLLRMHFFRIAQRAAGTEAPLTYASTGEQQSIPFRMRAIPDQTVSDEFSRIGYVLDQIPT